METVTTAENEALEAQLRLSEPQIWSDGFGYESGGWRVERHPRLLADVNGDSRDDAVGFGNGGVWVAISDGNSLERAQLWVANYGYNAGSWRVDRHPRHLADVNGDYLADIVGFGDTGVFVSLSTGTSFDSPSLWLPDYGYVAGNWRVDRHPRIVKDINGDQLADIVGFGDAGVYVSLSTGYGFTEPELWVANYGYDSGWRVNIHPRLLADANADGYQDVIGFGVAGTYVSLSNGSSFGAARLWIPSYGYGAGGWRPWHPRFAADVNADQRADIVGFGQRGAYVSLSTGVSFTSPRLWVGHYGYDEGWRVENHPRFVRDIDDDGRADIVGFGNAGAYVSYSNGRSFSEPARAVAGFGYDAGDWRVEKHPRLLGLMNRDQNVDIVGFGNDGVYVSIGDSGDGSGRD